MKKIASILWLSLTLILFLCNMGWADTATIDFTNIWIDHNDVIYLNDATHTLQWQYMGAYEPVGLWSNLTVSTQVPMHVTITNNGTTLMDQDWDIWSSIPTYWRVSPRAGAAAPGMLHTCMTLS